MIFRPGRPTPDLDQAEVARAIMALVTERLHGGGLGELAAIWLAYAEEAPNKALWACALSYGLAQMVADLVAAQTDGDRERAAALWREAMVQEGPDSDTEHARRLRGEAQQDG